MQALYFNLIKLYKIKKAIAYYVHSDSIRWNKPPIICNTNGLRGVFSVIFYAAITLGTLATARV